MAQEAVRQLKQAGFHDDEIGVASRGEAESEQRTDQGGSYAGEGALAGAAAGAGIGGLWALGIAAGMLPAIGPVIAGGLLASILASAAVGAAAGGLAGALIGLGVPEEEAEYYETEFKSGRTIVTVKADGRYDEAYAILQRNGAFDFEKRDAERMRPTMAGAASTPSRESDLESERTVRLHEEQLRAHKQPVETGEVRVQKEVHTEHRTLDVPVTKEEVVVERRPASGQPASSSDLREGETIRVPVHEEQVHVEKQPVVKEEIGVGKRVVRDTERVEDTVRKEEAHIEKKGDVDVDRK
jgi:uncharacterized protein (TIGR02271 family)